VLRGDGHLDVATGEGRLGRQQVKLLLVPQEHDQLLKLEVLGLKFVSPNGGIP
jgi:hypothetical protein